MTMKKILWLAAILTICCAAMFTACSENDDPVDPTLPEEPSEEEAFTPEVLLWVVGGYAAPDVDPDLKQALGWFFDDGLNDEAEGSSCFMVNKLSDLPEETIKNAFENRSNNFLFCVVNPVKAELEAFAEKHNWFTADPTDVSDSTFVYGFTSDGRSYFIMKPTSGDGSEEVEVDPIVENMKRAEDYYVYLYSMVKDFGEHVTAGEDSKSPAGTLEEFAKYYHTQVTHNFGQNMKFRDIGGAYDPDYMSGSGSLTISYDIYMAHVYEGEPGAGDYYGVKATASVASAKMWHGKGWHNHWGTYVRYCGAYCKYFIAESHLIASNDWNEKNSDKIFFPAGGFPSPSTTNSQTTYTTENSFSLDLSQTIGAEMGSKTKDTETSASEKKRIELSASEGWSWKDSESRVVHDVDIINETMNGNWARWQLKFNNLPYYQYKQKYGFNLGPNEASRGTMDLHATWLWYDKTGKDNEDKKPYTLCTWLSARYGIQSFVTTHADWKEATFVFSKSFRTTLPKITNVTSGKLVLKNNLKNEATVSNIQVCDADDESILSEYKNTVPNGGEQVLGFYKAPETYLVKFLAREPGKKAKKYVYSTNPRIELESKETINLYALDDFEEE